MTEESFAVYHLAFEGFESPRPFELEAAWGNIATDVYLAFISTTNQHEAELKRWIEDGRLCPRDCDTMLKLPGVWGIHAGLLLDDLRTFAASLQIDVLVQAVGPRHQAVALNEDQRQYEERRLLLKEFRALGGTVSVKCKAISTDGLIPGLARKHGVMRQSMQLRLNAAARDEAAAKKIERASALPASDTEPTGLDWALSGSSALKRRGTR